MRTLFLPAILATAILCFAFYQKTDFLIPTSFIYGYNNSIIIASVANANKAQIAYTSFEKEAYGYWLPSGGQVSASSPSDPGRTGLQYYSLGSLQRNALQAGKYTVSFWATGTVAIAGSNYSLIAQNTRPAINGWTYYEKVISLSANSSSVTLTINSGKIDEVRLLPFDALMTTDTYDPLLGKTSETDADNITTYYEYDEFGRVKRIKDQYGSIVKQYVYHYKGQ